jgi:hypothetical protein
MREAVKHGLNPSSFNAGLAFPTASVGDGAWVEVAEFYARLANAVAQVCGNAGHGGGFAFGWRGWRSDGLLVDLAVAGLVEELAAARLPVREVLFFDKAVADRAGKDFWDLTWFAIEVGSDFVGSAPPIGQAVGAFCKGFPSAHK